MEPDHPIVIMRLAFVFLCALPAVRELYHYINDRKYVLQSMERRYHVAHSTDRKAKRMGQHCWLLLATVLTELLVITKWSRGMFQEPLPVHVRWGWIIGGTLLILYPTVRVRRHPVLECGMLTRMLVWCPCCTTIPAQTKAEEQDQDVVIVQGFPVYMLYSNMNTSQKECHYGESNTRPQQAWVNVLVFTRAEQISVTKTCVTERTS